MFRRLLVCCFAVTVLAGVWNSAAQAFTNDAAPQVVPTAALPGEDATVSPPAAMNIDQILIDLGLSQVDIIPIEMPSPAADDESITLSLGGQELTLQLWRHSLRGDQFRLVAIDEFGAIELPAPDPRTYRGHVLDADGVVLPGSGVAAGISEGRLTAMIDLGDGSAWFIQPLADGAAGGADHAVFRGEHVLPSDRHCGTDTDEAGVPLGLPDGSPEGGGDDPMPRGVTTYKVTDIAFEADFPFYQLNGSNVVNTMFDIELVMNTVEFIYERDTDITYEITWIVVRTATDPYTSTNCSTLLSQFRNEWIANFGAVPRDIAHMMTGRNLSGGCLGVAYLDTICAAFTGNPYGLSESKWSTNFNNRVVVTAHELGHNWDAPHCDNDGNSCNIMCSGVGGCGGYGLPDFSANEQAFIEAKKNSVSCLFPSGAGTLELPLSLPVLDTIPNTSLDLAIWIYADGAISSTNAVNEPSGTRSINLDSTGSGTYDQDEIRTNFILLSGQSPVDVSFKTQHRFVEAGKQLIVEYWASNLRWITINTITSDGNTQDNFVSHVTTLTSAQFPTAFHNEFRVRFRVVGSDSSDDWYLDDISIAPSGQDTTPPSPSPMSFASLPAGISTSEMSMTATTATDPSGVTYLFTNTTLANHNSTQASPTYVDTGLAPNASYVYTVAARDNSPLQNTTQSSPLANGFTHIQTPTGIAFGPVTETSIQVTALGTFNNLTFGSSGIFFEMTPAAGTGANLWVQTQTINVTGLSPGTQYSFRVKARNRAPVPVETPFVGPVAISTTSPTTGACCTTGVGCTVQTSAACAGAGGDYQGDNTVCSPNPCPEPEGACCAGNGTCTITTATACAAGGGSYEGNDTVCSPNPCPQPEGACCASDGVCSIATAADCSIAGGDYQGDDTVCTPNPCPQPEGACCAADGACTIATAAACAADGGTYQGDDTVCTPNPCPQPEGACCNGNESCTITTADDCAAFSGSYLGDATTCTPNPCSSGCLLPGDVNGDAVVDGLDIGGFTRVVLGAPEAGDNPACADYGTGTLTGDIEAFIADLLD